MKNEKKTKKWENSSDPIYTNPIKNLPIQPESVIFAQGPAFRSKSLTFHHWRLNPARACYRSLSGLSGPKCPRSVPESVPENGGCLRECPTGCPKSVPRVSSECQKGVPDTLGTLWGHFLDTPEPGARRARGHPIGHSLGHPPIFGDTLGDTSGPKGPGDSCSRPAGSQPLVAKSCKSRQDPDQAKSVTFLPAESVTFLQTLVKS